MCRFGADNSATTRPTVVFADTFTFFCYFCTCAGTTLHGKSAELSRRCGECGVESEWTKLTKVKILVSGLCQEAGKAQNCLQTIRHYLQTVKNIVSFIGLYQAFSGKCLVKSGDTGEIIVTSSSRSHHKQLQTNLVIRNFGK